MAKVRKCFWCQCEMTRPPDQPRHGAGKSRFHRPDEETIDHIIPQCMLPDFVPYMSFLMRVRNKVRACNACNNKRGDMDAIIWSARHRPESMTRLADHLISMDLPMDAVLAAFRTQNPTFDFNRP